LGEFYQIFNFAALGTSDELISFETKRSKVKVKPIPTMIARASGGFSGAACNVTRF